MKMGHACHTASETFSHLNIRVAVRHMPLSEPPPLSFTLSGREQGKKTEEAKALTDSHRHSQSIDVLRIS